MNPSPDAVATLIDEARTGDEQALATLLPLVSDELRRLAGSYLRRERAADVLVIRADEKTGRESSSIKASIPVRP
jgi:hypothetical protein